MKLGVVILTHNNQATIQNCLASVKSADEIIVIDDNSTDKTLDFVKKYPAKIIHQRLVDFSHQRNLAIKQVKSDWVLFLDSDEKVTAELLTEIKQAIGNSFSAYRIKRQNYFFGKRIKHGGYWPDWQTRLFRVKDFRRFVGAIHESPEFIGQLGELDNYLIHFSHKNLIECFQKSLSWTKTEAEEFIKAGHPPVTWWRIIKVMIWEFCYRYFKKLGFLDGYVGFIESLIQAINRFFVYQQIWELQQK